MSHETSSAQRQLLASAGGDLREDAAEPSRVSVLSAGRPDGRREGEKCGTGGQTAVWAFILCREKGAAHPSRSITPSPSHSGGTEGIKGAGLSEFQFGPQGFFFFLSRTQRVKHGNLSFVITCSSIFSPLSSPRQHTQHSRVHTGAGGRGGVMRGKPASTSILLQPACATCIPLLHARSK